MELLQPVTRFLAHLPAGPWGHRRATRNAGASVLDDTQAATAHQLKALAEDRDRSPETPDRGEASSGDRDSLAHDSDRLANQHDRAAAGRDREARARDARSQARAPVNASPQDLAAGIDRHYARRDRQNSAVDRARAATDRHRAESDRSFSAGERAASSQDGLTGLYRRDAGMIELDREVARAARSGSRYVVAYIDVDGMKARNDAGGHAAGDRLLVQVAEAIRGSLRPYDLSIRVGGDEMVCGLPDISLEEAADRFAVLRHGLNAADAPISFGLADLQPEETLGALLVRADTAMYHQRHIVIKTPTIP